MNRWSVTVTGAEGERDTTEISDVGDLARTVGAAVVAGARAVVIVAAGEVEITTMPLRTDRLVALRQAWQVDDHGGTDFGPIVAAVRDLFDGCDGDLHALAHLPSPVPDSRIDLRLEPERVAELVTILDRIASLKVHSLGTNNAAANLSADIVRMAEQQGWKR